MTRHCHCFAPAGGVQVHSSSSRTVAFTRHGRNCSRSIPIELDESALIDGASPVQIYFRIYLPLMAPALVAVGTDALLLAWNEHL
jgi:ABC-type glycerol-3-phosphate transport system permease component